MPTDNEPRTEAGRRLSAWESSDARPLPEFSDGYDWETVTDAILAIEREATAAAEVQVRQLREALGEERRTIRADADSWLNQVGYLPKGWEAGRNAAIGHFVNVRLDSLLAIVDAAGDGAAPAAEPVLDVPACGKCGQAERDDGIRIIYHREALRPRRLLDQVTYACGWGDAEKNAPPKDMYGEHMHAACQRCHFQWKLPVLAARLAGPSGEAASAKTDPSKATSYRALDVEPALAVARHFAGGPGVTPRPRFTDMDLAYEAGLEDGRHEATAATLPGLDVERLREAIYAVSIRRDWEHTVDREDRTEEIVAEYERLGVAPVTESPE